MTDYSGYLRMATSASGGATTTGKKYTSRPALPRDAYDALIYGVCTRLVEKLDDERYPEFAGKYQYFTERLKTSLDGYERSEPLFTIDDSGLGPHADPFWGNYGR